MGLGTSATGLRTQIIHGLNGYIADDTETCAKYTLKLIRDGDLWRKLGKQAHLRVKDNYLLPTMMLEYLGALEKALGTWGAADQARGDMDSAASS